MKHTFTPKICLANEKGVPSEYEGTITLRMPEYDERMALLENIDSEVSKDLPSDSAEDTPVQQSRRALSRLRKASKVLPDHILDCNIKRKEDGFVFDSWDKLKYDSDMSSVIRECSLKLIGKFSVTDPSSPPCG